MKPPSLLVSCFTMLLLLGQAVAGTLGTAFTYQGQLADAGAPANGSYDFQFTAL